MSRAGSYGQSFAQKYIDEGRFDQAVAEAEKAMAVDEADPEPVLHLAQALLGLGRHEDAVAVVKRCLALDQVARIIDDMVLDDTLFSSLVGWGQAVAEREPARAESIIRSYLAIFPKGIHASEMDEWARRFRGERTTWTKDRS